MGRWEYEEAMVWLRDEGVEHPNEAIRLGAGDGEDGRGWSVCCA